MNFFFFPLENQGKKGSLRSSASFIIVEDSSWETQIERSSHMYRWMIHLWAYPIGDIYFPPPRYVRYLIEPDMPMTETLRGPPDHSLFPHRKREGGSLLALNTRKKTAALGSGSKLPLPRNRWRLYDSRGLHFGVDDEIRTHAGKANGNITFRSGAGI